MLRLYKVANGGTEMERYEEFVISVDCDTILPELQGRAEFGDTGNGGVFLFLFLRLMRCTDVGVLGVDSDLQSAGVSESYVLVALGDLAPGT